MNRQRNFKKNPHTARFLMAFHTGGSDAPAVAGEPEESAALAFVGGAVEPEFIYVRAYKIRTGSDFITARQAEWIVDIAERPSVTEEMRASLQERLEQGFARRAGSEFITRYKDIPTAARENAKAEAIAPGAATEEVVRPVEVAAGRYALIKEGVAKFYRITKGKGRWEGRTFVEAQASDDHWPIRNPTERSRILAEIAVNPLEAERRYGMELGKCSRCGRTLTDETSRSYGIGPECRKK